MRWRWRWGRCHSRHPSETRSFWKQWWWQRVTTSLLLVSSFLPYPPLLQQNTTCQRTEARFFFSWWGVGLQEGMNHTPLTPPQAIFIHTLNVLSCNLWVEASGEGQGADLMLTLSDRQPCRLGTEGLNSERTEPRPPTSVPPLVWGKLSRVSVSSIAFPAGAQDLIQGGLWRFSGINVRHRLHPRAPVTAQPFLPDRPEPHSRQLSLKETTFYPSVQD